MIEFPQASAVGFDTETTGLLAWGKGRSQPYMFTFASMDDETACVEFPVCPKSRRVQYEKKPKTLAALRKYMKSGRTWVAHNLKFDLRMCSIAKVEIRGTLHDSMLATKCWSSDEINYKLKRLCNQFFEFGSEDEDELKKAVEKLQGRARRIDWEVGESVHCDYWLLRYAEKIMTQSVQTLSVWKSAGPKVRERLEDEAAAWAHEVRDYGKRYGVNDAMRAILLWEFCEAKMELTGTRKVYEREMELMPVVMEMEERGVAIHKPTVLKSIKVVKKRYDLLTKRIKRRMGNDFNPGSPKQMKEYFMDERGVEPTYFTKKGNPSFDKIFLEDNAGEYKECAWIMEQQKCSKVLNTYLRNYVWQMGDDWVLHPSFNQWGARTGRFSCQEPNLQNVPKRAEVGDVMLEVRKPFEARWGYVWKLMDYAQVEARIFADAAEEPTMLEAFDAKEDVYEVLADNVNEQCGTAISRFDAKQVFLGKIYGMGVKRLIKRLAESGQKTDEDDAREVLDAFNETYADALDFMKEMIGEARRSGFITNRWGQMITVKRDFAYKATNYRIQSEAARLMKDAMLACHKVLEREYRRSERRGYIVMTIHDELVFELPKDGRQDDVADELKAAMTLKKRDKRSRFKLVDILVDVQEVKMWLEQERTYGKTKRHDHRIAPRYCEEVLLFGNAA